MTLKLFRSNPRHKRRYAKAVFMPQHISPYELRDLAADIRLFCNRRRNSFQRSTLFVHVCAGTITVRIYSFSFWSDDDQYHTHQEGAQSLFKQIYLVLQIFDRICSEQNQGG